jgi:hypothetical protein
MANQCAVSDKSRTFTSSMMLMMRLVTPLKRLNKAKSKIMSKLDREIPLWLPIRWSLRKGPNQRNLPLQETIFNQNASSEPPKMTALSATIARFHRFPPRDQPIRKWRRRPRKNKPSKNQSRKNLSLR